MHEGVQHAGSAGRKVTQHVHEAVAYIFVCVAQRPKYFGQRVPSNETQGIECARGRQPVSSDRALQHRYQYGERGTNLRIDFANRKAGIQPNLFACVMQERKNLGQCLPGRRAENASTTCGPRTSRVSPAWQLGKAQMASPRPDPKPRTSILLDTLRESPYLEVDRLESSDGPIAFMREGFPVPLIGAGGRCREVPSLSLH